MSVLKELNPHKNEVVRIKFKTINDIVANSHRDFDGTEEYYDFGSNVKAYLQGGDFIVKDTVEVDIGSKNNKTHYISVQNHLDHNYNFDVHDEVIESIEIVDDAERFISHDHRVLIVRVEDEMYINGHPLIWDEEKEQDKLNRKSFGEPEVYENPNRKLLKMFENFIADLAVKESFRDMNEGEE